MLNQLGNSLDSRTSLETYLTSKGYLFGQSVAQIERSLLRLMGEKRFDKYLRAAHRMHQGQGKIDALYKCVRSLAEANVLLSLDAQVTLECALAVYKRISPLLTDGKRCLELGCWTGCVSAWMATQHSDAHFIGVDRLPHVVKLAYSASAADNAEFVVWDYSSRKVPRIEPVDVLFTVHGLDLSGLNGSVNEPASDPWLSKRFGALKALVDSPFAHWAAIARPDATLCLVLRLPRREDAHAVVSAGALAGWSFDSSGSAEVKVGDEIFPLWIFRRMAPSTVDPTDIDRWWARAYEGVP